MENQIEKIISDETMQQVKEFEALLSRCVFHAKVLAEKHGIKINGLKEVPDYTKGTDNHPGGLEIVGDK